MTKPSYQLLSSLVQLSEAKLVTYKGKKTKIMLKGAFYLDLDELHSKPPQSTFWILKRLMDDDEYAEVSIFHNEYKAKHTGEQTYFVRMVDLHTSDVLATTSFTLSKIDDYEVVLRATGEWAEIVVPQHFPKRGT